MDARDVLVYLHVAFIFLFVLVHGASAVIAFRLRGERDPARVAVLLETSRAALNSWPLVTAMAGFVLTGIALGFIGGYWGSGWLWASIGILVLVVVGMTPAGAIPLKRARTALGLEKPRGGTAEVVPDPTEGQRVIQSWSPLPVAGVGGVGLLVILWLMMFKPF
jgi:hypothetical protein